MPHRIIGETGSSLSFHLYFFARGITLGSAKHPFPDDVSNKSGDEITSQSKRVVSRVKPGWLRERRSLLDKWDGLFCRDPQAFVNNIAIDRNKRKSVNQGRMRMDRNGFWN